MNKVSFHTLGCKVNQYETEAMEEMFERKGYIVVDESEISDIYIINTCTVTNLSDRKSRQFIRRAKKLNKDSIVAVVGCYSQVSPEEVSQIEDVDIIVGTNHRKKIVELCESFSKDRVQINIVEDIRGNKEFEEINIDDIKSKTRAYIKIQDGCNQYCSYCIIPYARGPIRSRRPDDIIEEVNRIGEKGFREIVLTGIHVASYGRDLKDVSLEDLILKLSQNKNIERIRLSSLEPNIITEEFMEKLVSAGKVCDHFHLSLQSGSNSVLKRMNRKYSREQYREKVELIRRYMKDAGITTDIIVGFPGETEGEFNDTYEFVKEISFSKIHVFKYSPRKGTPASEYMDQIHGQVKNERSEKLIELGDRLNRDFNERFLNKSLDVLLEEKVGDYYEGYTSNYIRVKVKSKKNLLGKKEEILIEKVEGESLVGKNQEG